MNVRKLGIAGEALLAGVFCGVLTSYLPAQSPAEPQDPLTFEVASVKPAVRPFGYIHRCPETRLIALKAPRYG